MAGCSGVLHEEDEEAEDGVAPSHAWQLPA
jgi:hypothetical protein